MSERRANLAHVGAGMAGGLNLIHSTLDGAAREGGGERGPVVARGLAVEPPLPVDLAHLFPKVPAHDRFLHPAGGTIVNAKWIFFRGKNFDQRKKKKFEKFMYEV